MVVRFVKMFRVILMTKTSVRTSMKNPALLIRRISTARVLFRRFGEILRDGVLCDGAAETITRARLVMPHFEWVRV